MILSALWIMSIDSNSRYLSAFKQCKLQLRSDYEDNPLYAPAAPKPFALFTVKAGALLFHYQACNYSAYRVFPIATIAGVSQIAWLGINDNIQRSTPSFHHEERKSRESSTRFVSSDNAFFVMFMFLIFITFTAGTWRDA